MSKNKKGTEPDALVKIFWYKDSEDDAEADIAALPTPSRDKAYAVMARLSALSATQFRIKKTRIPELWESKLDTPDGGLRVLFVYGKAGVVWCVGGFVKTNDAEGDRWLRHYASLAQRAKQT